ncbi:hypothetical protein TNCV_3564581 [Trichonephila clavipes]|nr:hypothetical protein TNCV_3564581 [Trichonephila clavipes]
MNLGFVAAHNNNLCWTQREYHPTLCHTMNSRRSTCTPKRAGGSVSQTKCNRLHEVQLHAQVPAARVPLTSQLWAESLEWSHRTWITEWRRLLFTDKSRFRLWRNEGH